MEQIKVIIGRDKSTTSVSTTESLAKTCPSLTRTQRLVGFGACFCLGYIISFGPRYMDTNCLFNVCAHWRQCEWRQVRHHVLDRQHHCALRLGVSRGAGRAGEAHDEARAPRGCDRLPVHDRHRARRGHRSAAAWRPRALPGVHPVHGSRVVFAQLHPVRSQDAHGHV